MEAERCDGIKPPLSGWLVKRKNETAASRLLKRSNRRYFTLDFESRTFFYAHSEGGKVSFPTQFEAILGVEPIRNEAHKHGDEDLLAQEVSESNMQRSSSKSSLTSLCMSKMTSLTSAVKPRIAQFGLIVRTRGKSFELFCDTMEDRESWTRGFLDAMEIASTGVASKRFDFGDVELVSTSGGSSRCTTSRGSSQASVGDSLREARAMQNSPKHFQDREAKEVFPSPVLAFDSNIPLDAPDALEPVSSLLQEASEVNSQESFYPAPLTLTKGYATPRSCDGASTLPLARAVPRSARSTSSGDKRSPRNGMVTSLSKNQCVNNEHTCWGRSTDASTAHKYSDKDKGLSISERLAQMDFSDDENSDGECTSSPRPSKDAQVSQGYASTLQPLQSQRTDSVVVEACETFVAPVDSDTDD